jgi:hypothetical protein
MKRFLLFLFVIAVGCSEDDPEPKKTYESLAGKWKYVFPDNKLSVEFTLESGGTIYNITNSVITYNGVEYTDHTAKVIGATNAQTISQFYFERDFTDKDFNVSLTELTATSGNQAIHSDFTFYSMSGELPGEGADTVIERVD